MRELPGGGVEISVAELLAHAEPDPPGYTPPTGAEMQAAAAQRHAVADALKALDGAMRRRQADTLFGVAAAEIQGHLGETPVGAPDLPRGAYRVGRLLRDYDPDMTRRGFWARSYDRGDIVLVERDRGLFPVLSQGFVMAWVIRNSCCRTALPASAVEYLEP